MKAISRFFTSSIQRKILSSFTIVIILVVVMVVNGSYQLTQVSRSAQEVIPNTDQMVALQDFALALSSLETNLESYFVIGGLEIQESVTQDLENLADRFQAIKERGGKTAGLNLAEIESAITALKQDVTILMQTDPIAQNSRFINEKIISAYSQIDKIRVFNQQLLAQTVNQLQTAALQQQATTSEVIFQFLLLGGGVTLLVIVASVVVTRSIAVPLAGLAQTAGQIAAGDLDASTPVITQTDEVGQLAAAFNSMTAQLRDLIGSLEQRVAARTRRLETVAVLSERLTAILHLDELLAELVDQVKANFGYYHAHIYLLDDRREQLVVAAGAGEAGAAMKAKGHHIALDAPTSLVARAARSGEPIRVDNVREAPDWLPNPLLPDTYSEMAVPIILAGQVVGVLDVQQDKVAGLDEGDANLLRSVAGQVAVAIRNARLFTEVNTALAEARASQERYIEQAWQKTRIASRFLGHHLYIKPGAEPLDEAKQQALSIVRQQAQRQSHPTVVVVDDDERAGSLVAPINLREKTIGALQLYTAQPDRSWSEDDLAVIEAVVDQFAETAENLRLFDETRERAGRERVIREITDKLRAAPNLERLVKIAAEELGQRLSASHAKLELGLDRDRPIGRSHAGQQG